MTNIPVFGGGKIIRIIRAARGPQGPQGDPATNLVTSVVGRTGDITLTENDITNLAADLAAKAPLASPALTGMPTAPTPGLGTDTDQLATTAFVQTALSNGGSGGGMANPMTTPGDIIYENSTPAPARLAGNRSTTKQFLTQTGNGSTSAAPTWGALAASDIPNIAESQVANLQTDLGNRVQNGGDLGGTATSPTVTSLHLTSDTAINHKLTSVTDPTNPQDAATKNYVDTVAQSLSLTTPVSIANGGTGQNSRQAAINSLTGTQSAGKYLRSDGVNAALSAIQASDIPTLNQNTTGTANTITGSISESQVTNLTTDLAVKSSKAFAIAMGVVV